MIVGIIIILFAIFVEMPLWLMTLSIIGASAHIIKRIFIIAIRLSRN